MTTLPTTYQHQVRSLRTPNEAARRRETKKLPVSVIIRLRTKERNLQACLESVAWAEEIFVVDSHSTDRTVEIAEAFGARWCNSTTCGVDRARRTGRWIIFPSLRIGFC